MATADPLRPDLCVIGGGAAGSAMAYAAVGLGLSCVLVETRSPLGRGQARDLALDALIGAAPSTDFETLRERIGLAVARTAPLHGAERLRAAGVRVVEATARFTDRTTVEAAGLRIRARRFVLATGARPVLPEVPGLDVVRCRTLDSVGEQTALPGSLAVVGSAPDAPALAQAFRRLGAAVTMVGHAPATDPELWGVVREALLREGVALHPGPLQRIEPGGSGAILHVGGDRPARVEVADVILAGATRPATDGLGLDQAGVARVEGRLVLRPDLRTSNTRVFAVGDVLGPAARGAAGLPAQVGTVVRAAFLRQPARYRPERVARVVRTDPPLAEVGLSEAEARATGDIRLFRVPFAELDRAAAAGIARGHLKVVATPGGRVLGAGFAGARAEDLIAPWVLAVRQGLSLDAMAEAGFAQPSLSDASRRAGLAFVVTRLRGSWVRRALAVMRRLG